MDTIQQFNGHDGYPIESAQVNQRGSGACFGLELSGEDDQNRKQEGDVASHAITKSITIDAPVLRLLLFVSDPMQWLRWTLFNVSDIRPITDVHWCVSTPLGPAKLRIRRNGVVASFEYAFDFDDKQWTVPGRILKNGASSELVLTLFQHESMSGQGFEEFSRLVDEELFRLKKLMEIR